MDITISPILGPHPLSHIYTSDRKIIPFSLTFDHFNQAKPGDWAVFTDVSVLRAPNSPGAASGLSM